MVADVTADPGQFRGEPVPDDQRTQVLPARDVPVRGGRDPPADADAAALPHVGGEIIGGPVQPVQRGAVVQAVLPFTGQVGVLDRGRRPEQARRSGQPRERVRRCGIKTITHLASVRYEECAAPLIFWG